MRLVLLFFISLSLYGTTLESKIANMIIIGFKGVDLNKTTLDIESIKKYSVGGVILFSHNLKSEKQLKNLTSNLQSLHPKKMFIAIDQEGGRVDRLKTITHIKTPPADAVSKLDEKDIKQIYTNLAKKMKDLGINLNFAPVVDLAVNPKNEVIYKAHRSYSIDPLKIVHISSIFIDSFKKEGIFCTLKHFPGHGSSLADSHKGFTDITKTWKEIELLPFLKLIERKKVDFIMSAHVYNENLDTLYPATLSHNILTSLLRESMKYDGIIISDDLQMGAIRDNYTLKQSLKLSINAGVDLLLFGNQLSKPLKLQEIINTIKLLVKEGSVSEKRIDEANRRIERVKESLSIKYKQ